MRGWLGSGCGVMGLAALIVMLPSAARADTFFTANLNGAEEVPANASGGTGFGRITLNDSETQITVSVFYQGLGSNVIMGHVHGSAAPGANAPILFDLNPTTGVSSGSVVGAMFAVTPTQVADLKAGLFYFNIHTTGFSGGEIRGQLRVDAPFIATLSGRQEVPAVASTGTGRGWVSLNAAGTQGLATLRWSGLTASAVAAHIHSQRVGVNGAIICDFGAVTGTTGEIVDAMCALTPTQANSLRGKGLYFNIHSGAFAGGEIRGQIKRSFNPCDFDGDGRSDYTVVRNTASGLVWFARSSQSGVTLAYSWGAPSDFVAGRLLCPDIDGDGKADPTIWRSGANAAFWSLLSGGGTRAQSWGTTGDDPRMIGDYDGDGRDDYTIVRESPGNATTWWILESSTGATRVENWGIADDFPVSVPDYDGDGKADLGVQRSGVFWRKLSSTGTFDTQNWGLATDFVHSADFDGDGKTDTAVSRTVSEQRQWWVLGSLTNAPVAPHGAGLFFGTTVAPTSIRTTADFDGDRRTDVVVWKPETGGAAAFWLKLANGVVSAFVWGIDGDIPPHSAYWK